MTQFNQLLSTFALTIALLSPVVVFLIVLIAWKTYAVWRQKRRGVRHPLSQDLLRPAGYSTYEKILEFSNRIDEKFAELFVLPFVIPTIGLVMFLQFGTIQVPVLVIAFVIVVLLMAIETVRLIELIKRRSAYKIGWEGEIAAADELNRLMLDGHVVYHDMPAQGFNIDHVVVGKDAIYAVETKLRTKRRSDDGAAFKVTFDGETLDFNGYRSSDALDQARRQAKWLSNLLSSSTGEAVAVRPLVLVPGWFVELKGRGDVHVLNPKQVNQLVGKNGQMEEGARRRVIHQLDQLCRGVSLSEIIR